MTTNPGAEVFSPNSVAPDTGLAVIAAIEHLRDIEESSRCAEIRAARPPLADSQTGHIAIFRLVLLDVVAQRFGPDGLCELRKAIFHRLTENLQPDDRIYDAATDTLVAICDRRAHPVRQEQLTAELSRILARNRDFPIQIGERRIMLRIPITLTIHAAAHLARPEVLPSLLSGYLPCGPSPVPGGNEMDDFALMPSDAPGSSFGEAVE